MYVLQVTFTAVEGNCAHRSTGNEPGDGFFCAKVKRALAAFEEFIPEDSADQLQLGVFFCEKHWKGMICRTWKPCCMF